MAKSRGEKIKQESTYVKLLLNNLTKMNSEIEKQGDVVSDLFQKENEARLEFDMGKKRGQLAEKTMLKEIQKMKRKLTAL